MNVRDLLKTSATHAAAPLRQLTPAKRRRKRRQAAYGLGVLALGTLGGLRFGFPWYAVAMAWGLGMHLVSNDYSRAAVRFLRAVLRELHRKD